MRADGKNCKNGKVGERAGKRDGVAAVVRRWSVAALASLALGTATVSSVVRANFEDVEGDGAGNAALEEGFFETLGRCESPLLVERNEAEDALFERFARFESIWQDRRFLTNGEIGAEARQRFELVEARYREKAFEECVGAFETTWETLKPEPEEGEKRGAEGKNVERVGENKKKEGNKENEENEKNERNEGNEGNKGNGVLLRGRVRLRWKKPLRIVYLSPDWSAFERRGVDGNRWRPSGRFSAPELAPEFDASELTFETTWERVDGEDASPESKNRNNASSEGGNGENGENSEGGAAVVGVLEGLIGGDFRVWTLPLVRVAIENAKNEADRKDKRDGLNWRDKESGENGGDRGDKEDEREEGKRDATAGVGDDFPSVFQSGDAVATVGETTIKENGETTARIRFNFAEAFDAFDSHRVWCDKEDFVLIIDDNVKGLNFGSGIGVGKDGEATRTKARKNATGAVARGDAVGRRWTAIRLRVRERSATGALFELDFPNDAALREAVAQGRARLACRIPRFFFWTRFEVAGIEKRNDGGKFNENNDKIGGGALNIGNK